MKAANLRVLVDDEGTDEQGLAFVGRSEAVHREARRENSSACGDVTRGKGRTIQEDR